MRLANEDATFTIDRLYSELGYLECKSEENEQLELRVKELEMVEQKYSKYLHKAWYVIEEAGYKNHDLDLKKFMEGWVI